MPFPYHLARLSSLFTDVRRSSLFTDCASRENVDGSNIAVLSSSAEPLRPSGITSTHLAQGSFGDRSAGARRLQSIETMHSAQAMLVHCPQENLEMNLFAVDRLREAKGMRSIESLYTEADIFPERARHYDEDQTPAEALLSSCIWHS